MKDKVFFECVECGYQSPKFFGKCPQCQNWNSMIEVEISKTEPVVPGQAARAVKLSEIDNLEIKRLTSGVEELDRVLGGGIVPDSVVLIGGEPGVGKSTLLLELAGLLSKKGKKILYYSGEESPQQIKIRASRLGINSDDILLLTMASLEELERVVEAEKPNLLIVDSIQTLNARGGARISGSVSAIRYVTAQLNDIAVRNRTTVFIIGHITKEGLIAGPKTLEHMVDTVLYFQGELKTDLRILRVEKNRFGPVDEIGIFQMTGKGLTAINDPASLFIQHREILEPGISIFPCMNGKRSILIEIQALVTESPFTGNPRRIAVGFDNYRMSMLISIIEKKLKLPFYKSDVFLNITGGMFLKETAGDLAIITALISSYKNKVAPADTIIIGEVGLTGEIRPVPSLEARIKEGERQGFNQVIVPTQQGDLKNLKNITPKTVKNIHDLYHMLKTPGSN